MRGTSATPSGRSGPGATWTSSGPGSALSSPASSLSHRRRSRRRPAVSGSLSPLNSGVPLVALPALPTVGGEFARPVAREHLPGMGTAGRRRTSATPARRAHPSARPLHGNRRQRGLARQAPRARPQGPDRPARSDTGARRSSRREDQDDHSPLPGGDGRRPSLRARGLGRAARLPGSTRRPGDGRPGCRRRGPQRGPAEAGWLVELEARPEPPDDWPVVWGSSAPEYRRTVMEKGSDARVLDDVAVKRGGGSPAASATPDRSGCASSAPGSAS